MKQILLRHLAAALLFMAGGGFLGVASVVAMRNLEHAQQVLSLQENPWRRTVRGWEKVDAWTTPRAPIHPHPLALSIWMVTASVGSLYCCSGSRPQP